jgi:hypothetical protein
MKIFLLGLALLLTKVQCQNDQSHPLLSYDFLKPASNVNQGDEFILLLDDDDGILVVDNSCDRQRFQRCVQSYANDLGLSEIPKDSTIFVEKLTQMIQEQGLDGVKRECRAGKNLKNCLANQYDQCISEKYLKSIGVQDADAKVFVTLSVQMAYQCTAGLDTIIQNWDCIKRVEREHRREFSQCQSDYGRKVREDPTNLCKCTQEMVNCMTTPFKQDCPPAVYGVLCHSMQIAIATTLPQCGIVCTKGSKDIKMAGEGRSDTITTFISRILVENIPLNNLGFRSSRRVLPIAGRVCDDNKFKRCIDRFAKDVGLSSLPKRAKALATYLNQLIATKKAAGFEQVCKASKNIGTCLGDQLESCFSVQHLESMGIMTLDVLIYRELQAGLTSECGVGYDVLHKNIDCLINCGQQHQTEFIQCASDFERNIKRDPGHVCDYAQTFLRCNTDLLEQTCGAEVSSASCNALHAELKVPLPTCKNLTCQSQADVSLIESTTSILANRQLVSIMDAVSESLQASVLRQPSFAREANAEEDADSDSDEDDDDDTAIKPKCDDTKFGKCIQAYAKQLGMKGMPIDPSEYINALHAILEKYGKIGFKKICSSGSKLVTCVGRRQMDTCMNISHLIELGLTQKQAYTHFVIWTGLRYECTKGFKVLYENFDCIANVGRRQNATFVKCAADLDKKIKRDPKNYCKYIQQFVNCEVKPFANKCKPEVATTICQTIQAELKPILPKCQIKCKREDEPDDDMIVGGNDDIGMRQVDEDEVADMMSV